MSKYRVWIDLEEQWDAAAVEPPDGEVEADNWLAAAEQFANEHGCHDPSISLIVADERDHFIEVRLARAFKAVRCRDTTLEELCSP